MILTKLNFISSRQNLNNKLATFFEILAIIQDIKRALTNIIKTITKTTVLESFFAYQRV
jgi:hypothetical protein